MSCLSSRRVTDVFYRQRHVVSWERRRSTSRELATSSTRPGNKQGSCQAAAAYGGVAEMCADLAEVLCRLRSAGHHWGRSPSMAAALLHASAALTQHQKMPLALARASFFPVRALTRFGALQPRLPIMISFRLGTSFTAPSGVLHPCGTKSVEGHRAEQRHAWKELRWLSEGCPGAAGAQWLQLFRGTPKCAAIPLPRRVPQMNARRARSAGSPHSTWKLMASRLQCFVYCRGLTPCNSGFTWLPEGSLSACRLLYLNFW